MNSQIQLVSQAPKPLLRLPIVSFEAINFYFHKLATKISTPQKVIIISVGTGICLVQLVARYLKRRKRTRKSALTKSDTVRHRKNKPITIKGPSSGEVTSLGGTISPGFHRSGHHRSNSISAASDRVSVASIITTQAAGESGSIAPEQYGVMGMEALEGAISLWEEAMSSYTSGNVHGNALPSNEAAEFTQSLQKVIEEAYNLQDQCEHLFLHQHSVLFKAGDIGSEPSDMFEHYDRRTLTSLSSVESFVSAQGDIADLRDLEEFEENPPALYISALKHHEEHGIPYRDIRTDWVKCTSDLEYICKVHCLRLCCHVIFSQEVNKEWFAEAGRNVISVILTRADKDAKETVSAYDDFLLYLTECDWLEVEAELKNRGVAAITFYDVVLDFILMDSFDDLENPPSSVVAVVQNRWLSNGFKESALTTAVWSVLKAKRRMLRHQDGFVAHFYDVTEHLSPVLAWGFLGPEHRLKEMCHFFRDTIKGLLHDMFSFSSVRYTTVEELSEDLLNLAHDRYQVLMDKLTLPVPNGVVHS